MKKLIAILCLSSLLLTATSCMRGGNVDKGDDGRINDTEKTEDTRKEKDTTDTHKDSAGARRKERRIMDTVEDFATDIERLPSRIRNRVGEAIKGNDNGLHHDKIVNETMR